MYTAHESDGVVEFVFPSLPIYESITLRGAGGAGLCAAFGLAEAGLLANSLHH